MKYIDADKLIAEIDRRKEQDITFRERNILVDIEMIISSLRAEMIITSLQQEQPVLPGIEDPGIPGKDFIPVEWVDACEMYGKWKIVKQEQPDNEDIDKVARELYEHLYELKRRNNVPTNLYDKQEIIDLWKAGIEYGRNHPKQEQPECIYGRTPEEREKCCKFCSAICESRIEQEQPKVDATTLRREAIGKAMEVYPPSINEDADGMPYDEHTDLQQGFITGYELGFNARKEE